MNHIITRTGRAAVLCALAAVLTVCAISLAAPTTAHAASATVSPAVPSATLGEAAGEVPELEPGFDLSGYGAYCFLSGNQQAECAPYAQGQALVPNLFTEGSQEDDDLEAAFVHGMGADPRCWVGKKSYPCSKVITPDGTGVQLLEAVESAENDDEYEEQRSVVTPIGGCPIAPSTPCYQPSKSRP